jgi:hypothetical protein
MFTASAADVENLLSIDTDSLNGLIRGNLWSLHLDAADAGSVLPGSNGLWLTMREGDPRLKIYYVLRNDTCRLMWLEVDPDWAASVGL